MPTECCFPHSEVEVSGVDTRDSLADSTEQVIQFCNVPYIRAVVKETSRQIGAIHGIVERNCLPIYTLEVFASSDGVLFRVGDAVVEVLKIRVFVCVVGF
jgi:N6-adenosine-specific RNA methylase IME4